MQKIQKWLEQESSTDQNDVEPQRKLENSKWLRESVPVGRNSAGSKCPSRESPHPSASLIPSLTKSKPSSLYSFFFDFCFSRPVEARLLEAKSPADPDETRDAKLVGGTGWKRPRRYLYSPEQPHGYHFGHIFPINYHRTLHGVLRCPFAVARSRTTAIGSRTSDPSVGSKSDGKHGLKSDWWSIKSAPRTDNANCHILFGWARDERVHVRPSSECPPAHRLDLVNLSANPFPKLLPSSRNTDTVGHSAKGRHVGCYVGMRKHFLIKGHPGPFITDECESQRTLRIYSQYGPSLSFMWTGPAILKVHSRIKMSDEKRRNTNWNRQIVHVVHVQASCCGP